jgi:translation initiation factor IF-3
MVSGHLGLLLSRVTCPQRDKEIRISDPRINDRIRAAEVRLVGPEGEQVGVVRIDIALRLAQEADLDLVEVSPNSNPPVVKVMDYGKFKYEAAQKAKEARKNQANTILKEVRFRLKIDTHDYETKRKRAETFLKAGDKVKAMILFRGREQSRPEQGVRLLQRFADDVAESGVVEFTPMIDGRNMVMIVAPLKSKADAKAAQAKVKSQAQQDPKPTKEDATPEAVTPPAETPEAVTPVVVKDTAEAAPALKKVPAKKPADKKLVGEESAGEKTVADESAPKKPVVKKPAVKKNLEKKEETDA